MTVILLQNRDALSFWSRYFLKCHAVHSAMLPSTKVENDCTKGIDSSKGVEPAALCAIKDTMFTPVQMPQPRKIAGTGLRTMPFACTKVAATSAVFDTHSDTVTSSPCTLAFYISVKVYTIIYNVNEVCWLVI